MKFEYVSTNEMINTTNRDSVYAYFDVASKNVYLPSDRPLEKFEFIHEVLGHGTLAFREETDDKLIEFAKSCLTRDGKILIAMKNKFGMKYWTGEKESENSEIFGNIVSKKENIFGIAKIKSILDNLKLKYKFYYPLPDYNTTNVIFSDKYLPTNDSIDARDLTYCKEGELLVFSEREAYKQLLSEDKNQFPFFANSFSI